MHIPFLTTCQAIERTFKAFLSKSHRKKCALNDPYTVKPEIFACPLFREFRDLRKFAKITGREYSTVNHLISTSLIEPNTKLTGNGH